jgi:uncharacterized protein YegL
MTRRSATAIVMALSCAAGSGLRAQSPTFSSRVEAVRLDVLVTQDGQPLRGLAAADFEVFDNGVKQSVDLLSPEQLPLSIVLALDVSASVTGERLRHLTDAGRAILDALKKDDRAALMTFTESISLDADLTSDVATVKEALGNIAPAGDTALTDGAYVAVTVADGSSGRGMVIMFSDGSDTASWLLEPSAIEAARRSEVVIYGIAGGRERSIVSSRADEPDRRPAVRDQIDAQPASRVSRRAGGIPAALSFELHANRCRETWLAQSGSEGQRRPRKCKGTPRLSSGIVNQREPKNFALSVTANIQRGPFTFGDRQPR